MPAQLGVTDPDQRGAEVPPSTVMVLVAWARSGRRARQRRRLICSRALKHAADGL